MDKNILEALLRQAMGEASEADQKENTIGKISFKLLRDVRDHDDREDALKDEIRERLDDLKKEFKPRFKAIKAEHEELWDNIMNELEIPDEEREQRYSLNMKNGDVYNYVTKEDQDSILN